MMERVRSDVVTIPYRVYSSPSALPESWGRLYALALSATGGSYAPYSGFAVGAVVELRDGTVVQGANQENVAYPSGMCAERVALYHAGAQYPGVPLRRLVVVACQGGGAVMRPVYPCGACCQALLEYAMRAPHCVGVLMGSAEECVEVEDARLLLPFGFTSLGGDVGH